jgi:hypothetical protein
MTLLSTIKPVIASDIVSSLVNTEVSISSVTTLTSSSFGKMHVLSGAAGYNVTLPTLTGNLNKIIGLRIIEGNDQIFGIVADGSDLIDGENTRYLWSGESAILLATSSGWVKIGGVTKPIQLCMSAPISQVYSNAISTVVMFDTVEFSSLNSSIVTDLVTNYSFIVPRKSNWNASQFFQFQSIPGDRRIIFAINVIGGIGFNLYCGIQNVIGSATDDTAFTINQQFPLNKDQQIQGIGRHDSGTGITKTPLLRPVLNITEIPTW